MARLNFNMPIGISPGGRPAAACEISVSGIAAAATPAAGQAALFAVEPVPANSIVPSLGEGNVVDPPAVSAAIRAALSQVQPRVRAVTLVVPDSAVRVFVLDFDTLPSKMEEAIPVLRFRLRKSVPFDVEHAGISFQVLSEGSARLETQWKVLAAIMPAQVLAEYEAAVRSAGYEPGAVLPSSLAAIAAIDSQEAVLAVSLSAQTLTTAIVSGNDILLYRTVELPPDLDGSGFESKKSDIQRSVAVAVAFFEDKLQVRPHRLLYSGILPAREFATLLDDAELAVGEIVPRPETGMASTIGENSVAGVVGALAGTN